ncbi:hypothetical protein [Nitrospira lenta]|uniref:Putative membrane protein n=1 Tax=Nitrospira lenta TaxID=1436998 RepID=A0A330L2J3_9BACT|nr:hypothetical protein [Nitrospira lenta]SPP63981.1 putative membrane protein [Nitrospira lenta]
MRWVSAGLTGIHRVLGVGIGLLVMLWFGSGAVLLFVPYPSLTEAERFQWLEPLQLEYCCVPLESVWSQVGPSQGVERVRLLMAAGRPVYVIYFLDGTLTSLWADRGEPMSGVAYSDALRIAQQGVPREDEIAAEALQDDQWTVQQRFDPYRPLWKVPLHDADGREVYVSSKTGEVVMETTVFERRWNTVGAVIHWLYVPVLRRHWAAWDQTVWWLAAAGVVTAATGFVLGLQHLHHWRRQGHSSPFSGIKRWHHLFGVAIGSVVCTWLLSGMFSMDHGRWFSIPEPTVDQRQRFMGGTLVPEDIAVPLRDAMRQAQLGDAVKEILVTKVGGVSYYVFRSDPEQQVVMSAVTAHAPFLEFGLQALRQAAKAVFPAHEIKRSEITYGDMYYYSTTHNPRPLPGLRVVLDNPAQTWLHIDMKTGQLMELMDHSRRVYRWLFHGLHSWDIPFLLEHDRQRKILLLVFCVAGFLFSLSGVYLGITVFVGRSQPKPPAT